MQLLFLGKEHVERRRALFSNDTYCKNSDFLSALPVTMLISMILIDTDKEFKVFDFWWMWPLLQIIVGIIMLIC